MKNIFTEKFMEVIKYEGAVSIVTWSNLGVNVSNTWNSYLRVPRDGRLLIPAAGMKKTERNVELNKEVKVTLGTKEVQGLWGPGAGFLLEGEAEFIYEGDEFELMKATFPFMSRVLAINVNKITQTV